MVTAITGPGSTALGERIKRRWSSMYNIRLNYEPRWRELAEFIIPYAMGIGLEVRTQGEKRTYNLYDGTASRSNQKLNSAIQDAVCSPAFRFAELRMEEPYLNYVLPVRQWLYECMSVIYAMWNSSNFYSESGQSFMELGCFGTGCTYQEEILPRENRKHSGLHFDARRVGRYCISEGDDGRVDTVFTELKMQPTQIAAKWKKEQLSTQLQSTIANTPDTMIPISIIHAVFPNRYGTEIVDSMYQNGGIPEMIARDRKWKWLSVYIEMITGHVIETGGFYENPYSVPRWYRVPEEIYGRGPGDWALPDIRSLNVLVKRQHQKVDLIVKPPLMSPPKNILTRLLLTPSGLTYVDDPSKLVPIYPDTNSQWPQIDKQELRDAVAQSFFSNLIDLAMPQKAGNPMTALEVQARLLLMGKILGPALGNFKREDIEPKIQRSFGIAMRGGLLPPVPEELMMHAAQGGNMNVNIVYEGPLEKAQRTESAGAALQFFQGLMQAAQLFPEVRYTVDAMKWAYKYSEATGVDQDVMRTPEEASDMYKQEQEAQAQQAQEMKMHALAQSAGRAAPALKLLQGPQGEQGAGGGEAGATE